jgi:hypothetical protein
VEDGRLWRPGKPAWSGPAKDLFCGALLLIISFLSWIPQLRAQSIRRNGGRSIYRAIASFTSINARLISRRPPEFLCVEVIRRQGHAPAGEIRSGSRLRALLKHANTLRRRSPDKTKKPPFGSSVNPGDGDFFYAEAHQKRLKTCLSVYSKVRLRKAHCLTYFALE